MLADYKSIGAAQSASSKAHGQLVTLIPGFEKNLLDKADSHFRAEQQTAIKAYFSTIRQKADSLLKSIGEAGRDESGLYEKARNLQALCDQLEKTTLREATVVPLGQFMRSGVDLGQSQWLADFFLNDVVGDESRVLVRADMGAPLANSLPLNVLDAKGAGHFAGNLAIRKKSVLVEDIGSKADFPAIWIPSLTTVSEDSHFASLRVLELQASVSGKHTSLNPIHLIEEIFQAGQKDFPRMRQVMKEYLSNVGLDGRWVEAMLIEPSTYSFVLRTPEYNEAPGLHFEANMTFPISNMVDWTITLDLPGQKIMKVLSTCDHLGKEEVRGMDLLVNRN